MKKLSFLSIVMLGLVLFSCQPKEETNFTLNATIKGSGNGTVYLEQRKGGEWVKFDSTELKEDKATFKGMLDLPEFFYVSFKEQKGYLPVFLEQGNITVTSSMADLRNSTITGSKSQTEYDDFMKKLSAFDEQANQLGQRWQKAKGENNEEEMQAVEDEYEQLEKDKSQSMLDYAKTNNESVVPAFIVMSNSYLFELEQLDAVVNGFSDKIANSYYVNYLKDRVATLKRVAVGQKFVDFTLNDPDGNPISLASKVNGNYVLVDFWASWCGPCRAENPNVVEAYNKYHEKGFDVFGVSFDKDHDKWVEAIEKDNLVWTHVSDLKFWSCEAGKLYGVQSIPHNILLDPDGVIVEKNLRGEALQNKLAEIYGE